MAVADGDTGAIIRGGGDEGHQGVTGARGRVDRDRRGTGDRGFLGVADGDSERAGALIAGGVGGCGGHGRDAFREDRAGGVAVADGDTGAIIRGGGDEGHQGVTGARGRVDRDRRGTGDRGFLRVVDGNSERASALIARGICGCGCHRGRAFRKDGTGGVVVTDGRGGAVIRGRGRKTHNRAALAGVGRDVDRGRAGDLWGLSVLNRHRG